MQLDRIRAVSIVVKGKHPSCRVPEAYAAVLLVVSRRLPMQRGGRMVTVQPQLRHNLTFIPFVHKDFYLIILH
jgi:hypothetical protein